MMIFTTPKNFKRGRLINNKYRLVDLIIAGSGAAFSLIAIIIYLLALEGRNLVIAIVLAIPAVITTCLIIPFGLYHNILEMIRLRVQYSQTPKKYIWAGIYKRDVSKLQ